MKISLADSRVELAAHQVLRVTGAVDAQVICARGALWITQDHDRRDVILRAGESFTLDRDGMALVSAIEPSTVRLQAPLGTHGVVAAAGAIVRRLGRRITGSLTAPSHHPAIELRCY